MTIVRHHNGCLWGSFSMKTEGIKSIPTAEKYRTAVLLVGHGNREPSANDDLEKLAQRIEADGAYPIVEPCFLELGQPNLTGGADVCMARGASRVLIVPYFLSTGIHVRRDLAKARDKLRSCDSHVEFRLGSSLGRHPLLDLLVVEQIRELDREGR